MGQVISTVNMKGGVGKTTLTVNLATCLVKHHGKRVLVIDLDSQISATLSLMAPHDFAKLRKRRRTISYLISHSIRPNAKQKLTIHDLICPQICQLEGLELLPGDIELYDEYSVSEQLHQEATDSESTSFATVWNRFENSLIHDILNPVRDRYDFIIIDCAPAYNLLTRSGIAASDYYLLPARPEPLSVVGMQLLERRINKLKTKHPEIDINPQLLGIVFTLSGGGLLGRYYRQVMKRVRADFQPHQLFESVIPMDINVAKAVDMFVPVTIGMPNASGSKAFVKLTEEFLNKLSR